MARPLVLACSATDRTLPLILGDVRPAGIDLTFLRMPPEEVFWRMTRHAEFDAAEMSMSSYLVRRSRGDDGLVAIPVFPSRQFRHSCVFVRTSADIHSPADLKGARVGVAEYQITAAVWIRGFLADYFGVKPTDMRWYQGGMYQRGRPEKLHISISGLSLQAIGPEQTLSDMLLAGDLDAIIGARAPTGFPGPGVRRLFPDFRSVEADYARRTGVFPIMHTIVIRRELLDQSQWIARSLYDAFCESRRLAMANLSEHVTLSTMLPWQIAEVEFTQALMGEDFWPYGVEPNRTTLETLMRYSCEQGLAECSLAIESLFAPTTLDDFRI